MEVRVLFWAFFYISIHSTNHISKNRASTIASGIKFLKHINDKRKQTRERFSFLKDRVSLFLLNLVNITICIKIMKKNLFELTF